MSEEEINKIIEVYDEVIADLQQENSQLKERIEKAIKYIEECIYSVDIYEQFISTNETKKLLEILKGDKDDK